jgi:hypothetical protein
MRSAPAVWPCPESVLSFPVAILHPGSMQDTVIDFLEKGGRSREIERELDNLGLTKRTLNDPINRQRIITELEIRFPNWRDQQEK